MSSTVQKMLGLQTQVPREKMATKVKRTNSSGEVDKSLTFSVAAETWRFYAYCLFWFVVVFAIVMNYSFSVPRIKKGPSDGKACGAFARDDPEFGVYPGEGFNIQSHSHLNQIFGYNNICINWDYTPSRELTSIVYPAFEYSLIVYLCLDFVASALANRRGELTPWFWTASKIIFPLNLFFCSQFRQIFVIIAYEDPQGHTAAFVGLQLALLLVALQNTGFVYITNTSYHQLGGIHNTRKAAIAYLVGDVIISLFKIVLDLKVVFTGSTFEFTKKSMGLICVGQFIDYIWMFFNALIPWGLSYFRSKNEAPLKIVFSQEEAPYEMEEVNEETKAEVQLSETTGNSI